MTISMETDCETNWRLIRSPIGRKMSGRDRYAAAMYFYQRGKMDAATLEIYRICSKLDREDPVDILRQYGIGEKWIGRLQS